MRPRREILIALSVLSSGCLDFSSFGGDNSNDKKVRLSYIEIRNETSEPRTTSIVIKRDGDDVFQDTIEIQPLKVEDNIIQQGMKYIHGEYLEPKGKYWVKVSSENSSDESIMYKENVGEEECYRGHAELFNSMDGEMTVSVGCYTSKHVCEDFD